MWTIVENFSCCDIHAALSVFREKADACQGDQSGAKFRPFCEWVLWAVFRKLQSYAQFFSTAKVVYYFRTKQYVGPRFGRFFFTNSSLDPILTNTIYTYFKDFLPNMCKISYKFVKK
jgi:hypothetical protein